MFLLFEVLRVGCASFVRSSNARLMFAVRTGATVGPMSKICKRAIGIGCSYLRLLRSYSCEYVAKTKDK
eukprot:3411126-Amphidinium_carterae.1